MEKEKKGLDSLNVVRICPFCGHHGQEMVFDDHPITTRGEDGEVIDEHPGLWRVECRCCGARGPVEYDEEAALTSWNTRHGKPAHNEDPEYAEFSMR